MALFFGEWEFLSQENTIEICKFFDHRSPLIKIGKCQVKVGQMMTDSECVEADKRNWK